VPLYPGSTDTLSLTVDPFDATTGVTVVVEASDGTTLTPTMVTADSGHTWTGNPVYPLAGEWVAHYVVIGTGAGVTEQEIWVSTPASPQAAVAWRPDAWHVADYIPGRTLVGAVDGYGNALNTFTGDTHPPLGTVQRLITAGCAWVGARVANVDSTLTDLARAAAACWAAAQVERGYPDNSKETADAAELFRQANALRDDLQRANEAVTGEDPEDPQAHLMPVYSFPNAATIAPWGDWDFL
jgi:hypothetical protein